MKYPVAGLALALLLTGCASTDDLSRVGNLDFFDWLDRKRGEYNESLNSQNLDAKARIEVQLSNEVSKRYELVAEQAVKATDSERRGIATFALGFSRRPEAVAHLTPALSDPVGQVRASAAAAIGLLAPARPPVAELGKLLTDVDPYVRLAGLFALKLVLPEATDTPLADRIVEMFTDEPDPNLRNEAAFVLGRLKLKKLVPVLVKKGLADASWLVRRSTCIALGAFGPDAEEAIPFLIERLKDQESGVVEAAHWALKKITGRADADRQYTNWFDWYNEQAKVIEYVCLKCSIVNAVGGICPNCGKRMESRSAGIEYVCSNHPEVTSPRPGKCAKCQMELLPSRKKGQK
jgi:HEAT repeat protein